jgi:4-amino-4-deoxy-L-arabinose transferase-like glycosyltransferase
VRPTLAAAAVAFALTMGYAALVQPDWESRHTDQLQYLSLARAFVERGEFTRATGAEPFFPETYRLPGYPLLLAPSCAGGCDHWRIAILQALLVAGLVVVASALARRLGSRAATAAAFATALFLPFPYYGALALSDLPGAALFGLGLLLWIRAVDRRSARLALAAGALFGWAALIRGALVLAPLALAAVALLRDRGLLRVAASALVAAAVVFAPYVAYSETQFGRASGGTTGLVLFYGVFQGRSEASLDAFERAQADEARAEIAAFDAIDDRAAKARAWLALDDALGAHGRALIAHDPIGWVARGALRSIELWAGERPVPGGASGDLALALSAAQLVLVFVALAGTLRLARGSDQAASAIVVVVLYVWLTALPFQTEARYALPAKMPAIVAGILFIEWWLARRRPRAAST